MNVHARGVSGNVRPDTISQLRALDSEKIATRFDTRPPPVFAWLVVMNSTEIMRSLLTSIDGATTASMAGGLS